MDSEAPHQPIEAFLNELDEVALQLQVSLAAGEGWSCRRDKLRRRFRVACELWHYADATCALRHQAAHTRNISEKGVALIAAHGAVKGAPIEIRIAVANRPRIHLAGLVAFSRATLSQMYEIGVALKVQQNSSIFHDDPAGALASTPWIRDAVRSLAVRSRTLQTPF